MSVRRVSGPDEHGASVFCALADDGRAALSASKEKAVAALFVPTKAEAVAEPEPLPPPAPKPTRKAAKAAKDTT